MRYIRCAIFAALLPIALSCSALAYAYCPKLSGIYGGRPWRNNEIHSAWTAYDNRWNSASEDERLQIIRELCAIIDDGVPRELNYEDCSEHQHCVTTECSATPFYASLPQHEAYWHKPGTNAAPWIVTAPNPNVHGPARVILSESSGRVEMVLGGCLMGGEEICEEVVSILTAEEAWYRPLYEKIVASFPEHGPVPEPGTERWDTWKTTEGLPKLPSLLNHWYNEDFESILHFLCYEMGVVHVRYLLLRFESDPKWQHLFEENLLSAFSAGIEESVQQRRLYYNCEPVPAVSPTGAHWGRLETIDPSEDSGSCCYYLDMKPESIGELHAHSFHWLQKHVQRALHSEATVVAQANGVSEEHLQLYYDWMFELYLARECPVRTSDSGATLPDAGKGIDMTFEEGSITYRDRICSRESYPGAWAMCYWSSGDDYRQWPCRVMPCSCSNNIYMSGVMFMMDYWARQWGDLRYVELLIGGP